ncbi:MAG: hypothetical protein KIT27_08035 [Legionellales bacterium]|nr:hypothetical protein [Legionellales bacterium]
MKTIIIAALHQSKAIPLTQIKRNLSKSNIDLDEQLISLESLEMCAKEISESSLKKNNNLLNECDDSESYSEILGKKRAELNATRNSISRSISEPVNLSINAVAVELLTLDPEKLKTSGKEAIDYLVAVITQKYREYGALKILLVMDFNLGYSGYNVESASLIYPKVLGSLAKLGIWPAKINIGYILVGGGGLQHPNYPQCNYEKQFKILSANNVNTFRFFTPAAAKFVGVTSSLAHTVSAPNTPANLVLSPSGDSAEKSLLKFSFTKLQKKYFL